MIVSYEIMLFVRAIMGTFNCVSNIQNRHRITKMHIVLAYRDIIKPLFVLQAKEMSNETVVNCNKNQYDGGPIFDSLALGSILLF